MEQYQPIAGRDVSDVRYFVMARLMNFIQENRHDEDMGEEVTKARVVRSAIRSKVMLHKNDAKWLEEFLHNELSYRVVEEGGHQSNLMLWIDDLSIYSDAWGLYCRPGTYHL